MIIVVMKAVCYIGDSVNDNSGGSGCGGVEKVVV